MSMTELFTLAGMAALLAAYWASIIKFELKSRELDRAIERCMKLMSKIDNHTREELEL